MEREKTVEEMVEEITNPDLKRTVKETLAILDGHAATCACIHAKYAALQKDERPE